jgi:lon-related putative ATP-dependent protease
MPLSSEPSVTPNTPRHPLALADQDLYRVCDLSAQGFATTAELKPLTETLGQERAMEAVHFGAGMRHQGYNLFVFGDPGLGKRSLVAQYLQKKAAQEPAPLDWCYVNHFAQPHQPLAIQLPSGRGLELQQQMAQMVDYLRSAIPKLFETDAYRAKLEAIHKDADAKQEALFQALDSEAREKNIALVRTPAGFALAPARNQEVIDPHDYDQLSQVEKDAYASAIEQLQNQLEKILRSLPQFWRARDEKTTQLNRETIQMVLINTIASLRQRFAGLTAVQGYLDAVQADMIEHVEDLRKWDESTSSPEGLPLVRGAQFQRYQVNALVSNGKGQGAPLVTEESPHYNNLVGRIEHIAQWGALVTDFTLIKPGALHRANGGYLLLDAWKVLTQPFAWEGLKHALRAQEIRIESLGSMLSLVSTVSLEPQPIPLHVKIVLFGDPLLYYLLHDADPDFAELFKVAVDFEEDTGRTEHTHTVYARWIASMCQQHRLLPMQTDAVARVIEHSARLAGDAERLSTRMGTMLSLLQEADFFAREAGLERTSASHVQHALDAQARRQDRLRDRLTDAVLRGQLLIATEGEVVGQINALTVIILGDFSFAHPVRVTGTTRMGHGEMVNIEREVELSGAIHSKGVMILSSFLASRYARNAPLALSATLVFEQSYAMVDGDSASLAEVCVLLSHLANVPIRQNLSVTGSINQWGEVQAVGGVNEKIEGYFNICQARGLNGSHGVLLPVANVKHLMLQQNVRDAVAAGQFAVYAVQHVDQAIELLTGMPAGVAGADGRYPSDTINGRVAARIAALGKPRKALGQRDKGQNENNRVNFL